MRCSIRTGHPIPHVLLTLRRSEAFRRGLLLGIISLIGVVIGHMVVCFPYPQVLAVVLGTTFMAVSIAKIEIPFYVCVLLLVVLVEADIASGGNIFRYLRDVNFHGIPSLLEMTLGGLILSFSVRVVLKRDRGFLTSLLNLPLIIFLCLLGLSLFVGLQNDVCGTFLKEDFKRFLIPVLFFVCCFNILSSWNKIKFLMFFVVVVAFVKSCLGNIFYLKGIGLAYGEKTVVFAEVSDQLIFVSIILVFVSQILHGKLNRGKLILVMLPIFPMLFTLIFSYRRHAWLGLLLSLGLLFLLVRGSGKLKILSVCTCGALFVFLLSSMSSLIGTLPSTVFLKNRFYSIGDKEQGSNVAKFKEWAVTFEDTMKHPIIGLGLGSTHRPISNASTLRTHTVHNAFLMLWMKMGIFALLLFLWCLLRYFTLGIRASKSEEYSDLRPFLIGLFSTFGFWVISLNVCPSWFYYRETCLMALIAALVINISKNIKLRKDEPVICSS